MSNKFSQKRQTLPRPKVCKSKPPKPDAPGGITSEITPTSGNVGTFGVFQYEFTAYDPAEDLGTPIDVIVLADCGLLPTPDTMPNGGTWQGSWQDFFCSSPQTITVRATSPSGAITESTAEITIS